jgi:hypothetical protein
MKVKTEKTINTMLILKTSNIYDLHNPLEIVWISFLKKVQFMLDNIPVDLFVMLSIIKLIGIYKDDALFYSAIKRLNQVSPVDAKLI